MSYLEVLQQIKKKQIAPVFLLYGSESFFIQNLKKHIVQAVVGSNDDENLITYDLEEVPIQEVVADAETYPFFGEKKLIFATNPVFLKAKPRSEEHTSELQSRGHLVCRLLLEKKKKTKIQNTSDRSR